MELYTIQTRFPILTGKSFPVVALIFTFNYALDSLLYIKHLADIMKPDLHRLRVSCSLSE
jgi:hypothetical protein